MPTPATLLTIATLLPLAAFVLLVFVGKRMGTPLAGYVGTAFIGAAFVCSIIAMISWYDGGMYAGRQWGFEKGPINIPIQWIPIGTPDKPSGIDQDHPGFLDLGIFVDSLTITMFAMITLVSTLVFIFSIGYMAEDKRFPRFFTYLGLFCFSMLGLVIGGTTLQLFIFWELVGLCSYLLIGFWYEKKSASNAAIKAFIVNRVGDFGFLIGFGILFYHIGNVTLPHMWVSLGNAGSGLPITLSSGVVFSSGLLSVMGIGLFFGAVGKSAQFPLHVWLPDAMEGPTPVSALIHAATMVAAGVYLVGRIFPLLTPDAKLFIAIIGCTTLTMAALIAIAQTDIKKVLAYSTLSQLGYMILAMGVGSWVGGLFHLITHAFFKALLFLGSGSVIHAAHHEQEMPKYGGLIRKIPVTGITFGIAVLAISGVGFGQFGFSGFYSKDMILAHAGAFATLAHVVGKSKAYYLLFALPTIIAFVTPFYMTRCWMMTFAGKPRDEHLYEHAHESPIMWGPLVVLAILAVISGKWMSIQEMIEGSIQENTAYCRGIDPSFHGFGTAWPSRVAENIGLEVRDIAEVPPGTPSVPHGAPPAVAMTEAQHAHVIGHEMVEKWLGFWGFTSGILAGVIVYWRGLGVAQAVLKFPPARWVRNWLYGRMYFDELYFYVFVNFVMAMSWLAGWFDRIVVDGIVNGAARMVREMAMLAGLNDRYVVDGTVNGVGELAHSLGAAVRAPATAGRV
ncbi:MAG TPA: NADH-quinone oxidoreductase subunit L, partial [Tepidisphaeraceae bacterium]|nr:NADH-quinone oxidoreductase subunit L [Tepidisphaeraceae bacterium]